MTPLTPYLIRTIYEWILDNEMTPHIMVNSEIPGTMVPVDMTTEGKIILSINPFALENLIIENESISFNTRFSGVDTEIYIPIAAVMAIYSKETGQGMIFELDNQDTNPPQPNIKTPEPKPKLRIV